MSRSPEGRPARAVRVLPDVAGLDKEFDYLVPAEMDGAVGVGTSVRVPLHGRRVAGWVVADHVDPPPGVSLRPLAAVRGLGPDPEVVDTARWAAWRWAGRLAAVLVSASPPRLVDRLPAPGTPVGPAASPPVPQAPSGVWVAALQDGRAVVRLAPAAPRWPAVEAVVSLLRLGGSVLVLCPRALDGERVARRLRAQGVPVAAMPDGWSGAAAGGRVVIGARAAAWAPAPGLAAAVVLDAHDEAYKEERTPTWNAWEVVAERCRRAGVPCLLTSATPSPEMLRWGRLFTTPRAEEHAGWTSVEVVDRRGEDPRAGLFSTRVVDLVREGGRPDLPVVCVLNRKGRARLLACRACGELVRCDRCSRAMSSVRREDGSSALTCGGCGSERPAVCVPCGSQRLAVLRAGVARVAEELAALAGHPVPEITSERQEGWGQAPVLVGTEAVLHQGRRAAAVIFLDFDQELMAPRFRAGEAALSLLARAARTAGGRGGRLVVQTRAPDHPVLVAAARADPGLWLAAEEPVRSALALPPYGALALIGGPDGATAASSLAGRGLQVAEAGGGWLVRAPDHRSLCDALAEARTAAREAGHQVRIEVDPLRV